MATPCRAQLPPLRDIKVPYGLSWGDSPDKIHDMIGGVKARETASDASVLGKLVIDAEGLGIGDTLLKKSRFTFRNSALVEIELQYADPAWDGEKAVDFFDRTRRRIDERYGPGTLMVNKVKETPTDENVPKDTTYTLIIYSWVQPAVALELSFYTLEDKDRAYRIVSLHYKAP